MLLYHGTGYDTLSLRDTQQTATQRGVGLTPHLECARNFGRYILAIEVPDDKVKEQTHIHHPDCHWADRDAMIACAVDCTIVDIVEIN